MYFLDSNVLIVFLGNGRVRLYHTTLRRNLIVSLNSLNLFDRLKSGLSSINNKSEERYYFLDATEFTLWNGMYENPDFFGTELSKLPAKKVDQSEFIEMLSDLRFVHDSPDPTYNLSRNTPFDRFKGTINEQIATEALFRKTPVNEWWAQQKFSDSNKAKRSSLYHSVQERFLREFFREHLTDVTVLDVGAGLGQWSFEMAKHAKVVLGVDYDQSYVDIASQSPARPFNTSFVNLDMSASSWARIDSYGKFDFIFLIDVFIYLADEKMPNGTRKKRQELLCQLRNRLSRGGMLVIMDPHLFWLTPRFGSDSAPFGVLTEYKKRSFGVVRDLEDMTESFYESGLAIRKILEPQIDPGYEFVDKKTYSFVAQFPQWIVWLLSRADET